MSQVVLEQVYKATVHVVFQVSAVTSWELN